METDKRYVIKLFDTLYWADDGRGSLVPKNLARKYWPHELPRNIRSMVLFRKGQNPIDWFYCSMCGSLASLEIDENSKSV